MDSDAKIRPMEPADLEAAKTMMLTVAAGIFDPDHPAASFINRYGAALSDVDDFQRHYGPPGGTFLVATVHDRVIGTGAIRRIDDETAELRRMWLLEDYHGLGIGYRLAQALLAFAQRAGYKRVRLSTTTVQTRAVQFYKQLGFYPIERYRDTDDEIFLELHFDAGTLAPEP